MGLYSNRCVQLCVLMNIYLPHHPISGAETRGSVPGGHDRFPLTKTYLQACATKPGPGRDMFLKIGLLLLLFSSHLHPHVLSSPFDLPFTCRNPERDIPVPAHGESRCACANIQTFECNSHTGLIQRCTCRHARRSPQVLQGNTVKSHCSSSCKRCVYHNVCFYAVELKSWRLLGRYCPVIILTAFILSDESLCTKAFFRVIDTAISYASGLVGLELSITEEGFQHLDILAASTFPYLRMLKLSGEMSENLARFIRTHSKDLHYLTYTHARLGAMSNSDEAIILPRCPLNVSDLGSFPHLTTYNGDGRLLPLILPGSLVHRIHIYFVGEKDVTRSLGFLHTVFAPLQYISLVTTVCCPDALAVIFRQVPSVTSFHWRCLSIDAPEGADFEIVSDMLNVP